MVRIAQKKRPAHYRSSQSVDCGRLLALAHGSSFECCQVFITAHSGAHVSHNSPKLTRIKRTLVAQGAAGSWKMNCRHRLQASNVSCLLLKLSKKLYIDGMPIDPSRRASVIAARFSTDFPDADPKAKEIAARLIQVVALFENDNRPLFEHHQIDRGLFSALVSLRLAGEPYELRHRDLMERMLLTSGGTTNLCRRLVKLELIEKHPDPDDARGVYFRLTEQGIAVANDLLPKQHRIEQDLISVLSAEEKVALSTLLEKITENFNP